MISIVRYLCEANTDSYTHGGFIASVINPQNEDNRQELASNTKKAVKEVTEDPDAKAKAIKSWMKGLHAASEAAAGK
jgi:hypothetical protein